MCFQIGNMLILKSLLVYVHILWSFELISRKLCLNYFIIRNMSDCQKSDKMLWAWSSLWCESFRRAGGKKTVCAKGWRQISRFERDKYQRLVQKRFTIWYQYKKFNCRKFKHKLQTTFFLFFRSVGCAKFVCCLYIVTMLMFWYLIWMPIEH